MAEDPSWLSYEQSVATMLSELDDRAEVLHNQKVLGRLSGRRRQIDVLVRGWLIGIDLTVVVECKRYARPVEIGTMDGFIGKLIDLGADRGVIYSFGGFTSAAVARAVGALNPSVLAVSLHTPSVVEDLHGVPGYPVELQVQSEAGEGAIAPQWFQEMDGEAFRRFLISGEWSKWWS